MFVQTIIYATIALLALFVLVGFVVVAHALRTACVEHRLQEELEERRPSIRERIRRYVGPVTPDMAIIKPKLRVLAEFFFALCGFPGLGWLLSGRVFVGLLLFSIVPSFVWAFYPMYLCATGAIAKSAFLPVVYLPALGMVSATALGIADWRDRRRGEQAHEG